MRYVKAAVIAVLVVALTGLLAQPAEASDVSFSFFYSNLSPHGSWLVSGEYGRVWQPAAYGPGWSPYYDGHWVYTDVGWTWVSDYAWGDVCYHYGTWVADPGLGWVWVPGYVWAPAWVVFRTGPDYIGWAPVSPGFSLGVSAGFGAPAAGPFVFVSSGHFLAPRIRGYAVPESRTRVIINNTRVINNLVVERNVVVNRGPDVKVVERASGRRVREIPIERVPRAAPGRRVVREQLAVDPQRMKRGVRAAEPVSSKEPAPEVRGTPREKKQRRPEASNAPQPRRQEQEVRGRQEPREASQVRGRKQTRDASQVEDRQVVRGRRTSRNVETQRAAPRREDPSVRGSGGRRSPRRETAVAPSRPQPEQGGAKAGAAPAKGKRQKGKPQRPVRRKPSEN